MDNNDSIKELTTLTNDLFNIKEEKDSLKAQEKSLNQAKREIEEKIKAIFDENDIQNFSTAKGKIFERVRNTYKLTSREEFIEHIGKDTWDTLATVNSRTLGSYCKNLQEAKEEEGDHLYEIPGIEESGIVEIGMRKS